jgi:hypothetical protein
MLGRVSIFVVFVSLLLLLSACGGDKKSDSNSSSGGSSSSSSQNTGAGGSSNSGDAQVSLENCKEYLTFATAAASAFSPTTGSLKLDKNALNNLVKTSPKEIKADVEVVIGALVAYFDAVEKLGVNLNDPQSFARLDPAKLQQMDAASEKFDDPKVQAAADRVDAFFETKCS